MKTRVEIGEIKDKKKCTEKIKEFINASDHIEEQDSPEVVFNTGKDNIKENIKENIDKIGYLNSQEYYSEKEKKIVETRLKNLGYL